LPTRPGDELFTGVQGADRTFAERDMTALNALWPAWTEAKDVSNAGLSAGLGRIALGQGASRVVISGATISARDPALDRHFELPLT